MPPKYNGYRLPSQNGYLTYLHSSWYALGVQVATAAAAGVVAWCSSTKQAAMTARSTHGNWGWINAWLAGVHGVLINQSLGVVIVVLRCVEEGT